MAGTLYLVATPIGNLEDTTYRAVRTLGQVDLVACEDTRQTGKLLAHYGIRKPMVSYHEHNESTRTPQLLSKLERGMDVALVADAGTPLVSDPGYRLTTKALECGISVVPLPGPAAFLAALTASGLPADSFHFAGFLPAKAAQRRRALEELKSLRTTVVLYEAPHRILETLGDVERILPDRRVVVARELTKLHEEFLRGTAGEVRRELAARPAVKGEFTLLIAGAATCTPAAPPPEEIRAAVDALLQQGMKRMEAMKSTARRYGLPKRTVYRILEHAEPGRSESGPIQRRP